MEKIYECKTKGKLLRVHEDTAVTFSIRTKELEFIDLTNKKISLFYSKYPVKDVYIQSKRILVFSQDFIEIFESTSLNLLFCIVCTNVIAMFSLANNERLFLKKSEVMFYTEQCIPKIEKIQSFSLVNNFLLIFYKDKFDLYEDNVGLVLSKKIKELEFELFTKLEFPVLFSIKDNKIYIFNEMRIIGPDLNLYLTDLDPENKMKLLKFQNIENNIILLKDNNKMSIHNKGFTKIIFEIKANDFYFDAIRKRLVVMDGSEVKIYVPEMAKPLKFELIEENKVYSENEDEFDISNEDLRSF